MQAYGACSQDAIIFVLPEAKQLPPVCAAHSFMKTEREVTDVAESTSKIMVLAVQKENGRLVITPIDIEHEPENQTALTADEEKARKVAQDAFLNQQPAMEQGLGSLYDVFANELHRGHFRTFENFCFALYGMNRIPEEKKNRIRGKVCKLAAKNQEEGAV
jgi:hypothetical protein